MHRNYKPTCKVVVLQIFCLPHVLIAFVICGSTLGGTPIFYLVLFVINRMKNSREASVSDVSLNFDSRSQLKMISTPS